jgi:hypothetical protein
MTELQNLTVAQLRRVISIKEKIESLTNLITSPDLRGGSGRGLPGIARIRSTSHVLIN